MEIETNVSLDMIMKYKTINPETNVQLSTLTQKYKGAIKHVSKSETVRSITRYDPEFLKHFNGSLMKAFSSNKFDITPSKLTIKVGIHIRTAIAWKQLLEPLFSAMPITMQCYSVNLTKKTFLHKRILKIFL
jgi:hypothetical protein